jgi:L-seryl-tRNA(Ser) seleniumtransferase
MTDPTAALRRLPQVHRLAESLPIDIAPVWRVEAAKTAIAEAREAIRRDPARAQAVLDGLADEAARLARRLARPHLDWVINATGVILHTNLGRAPLGDAVLEQIRRVARGYSTLEFDVEAGQRGSRHTHVEEHLVALTGAEAAMAVNNNAAAVLLALSELAQGGEVIVSRGQLVEIGGAFRVPDVMRQSGARLVEVGTTNKTRIQDYERAFTPDTRLILKVHTSNFRLTGFVEAATTTELVALGRARGVPVMEDLGSGVLFPLEYDGWREPSVTEIVRDGVDVITFSGDKLLGGPQAGIVVGRRDLVQRLKKHPLARALRVDKMTLAGLEMTLRLYREGRAEEIPLWRMLHADPDALWRRARRLAARLRAVAPVEAGARREAAPVGGGSLPGVELPTAVVRVRAPGVSAARLESRLRALNPPVVARIADDAVVFDLRTVASEEERWLVEAVVAALRDNAPDGGQDSQKG